MPTLIESFDKLGFMPEQPLKLRKLISVKENGRRYILKFDKERYCVSFLVDGGIITTGVRCDKLIVVRLGDTSDSREAEIFVELKGKDIKHAIEQLEATLDNKIFGNKNVSKVKARIVGQSIPKNTGNSELERAKVRFMKKYNCDLRAFSMIGNDYI